MMIEIPQIRRAPRLHRQEAIVVIVKDGNKPLEPGRPTAGLQDFLQKGLAEARKGGLDVSQEKCRKAAPASPRRRAAGGDRPTR